MSDSITRKMEKKEVQKELPEDLVLQQIFTLLPIKLLTQCKILSKFFNSSLCSPNFILKYTKQPLISHFGPPVENIIIKSSNTLYVYSCLNEDNVPEFSTNEDKNNSLVELNVKFDDVNLVGCSNGLVCLADNCGKYFILYNPVTNLSHKYYSHYFELVKHNYSPVFWGFGYVSSTNDYKVVRIMMYYNNNKVNYIDVFSHKTNSWKSIDFDMEEGMLYGGAKLANETLYWCKRQPVSTLAFDLASEKFKWFPLVAGVMLWGPKRRYMCLCVMGECISKCTNKYRDEVIIDILDRSWSMVSVCFKVDLGVRLKDEFIGFTKTGKVFVATEDGMLGLIDRNSKRILAQFGERNRAYIHSYVPTPVSPLPSTQESAASSSQGN